MYRAIPVSNKLLSKKWDEQRKAIHYKKLKEMKPSIDAGLPTTYGKLKSKAKKEHNLEGELYTERYTEIERENRILLEKMSSIFQTRPKDQPRAKYHSVKSLNKDARKKQLIQITMENQAMLRRLQDKQPSYDINKWEKDRVNNEKMLKNICEYPYRLGVTEDLNRRNSSENRHKITPYVKKPRKLVPLTNETEYKRGIQIADRYFMIEISKDKENLHITAIDLNTPETFVLEIPILEANQIMGGKMKYTNLINKFTIEDGQLVLMENNDSFVNSAPDALTGSHHPKNLSSSHIELLSETHDESIDPKIPCVKSCSEDAKHFSQIQFELSNKQSKDQETSLQVTERKQSIKAENVDLKTERANSSLVES